MKTMLILCAVIVMLGGCATQQQPSPQDGKEKSFGATIIEKIKSSAVALSNVNAPNAKRAGDGDAQVDGTTFARPRLRNTELKDIFANSESDKWPRVAVTINKLPKWFFSLPPSGRQGRFSPNDCINISITIWRNQKKSTAIDNMDFCGDDIVSQTPFADVGTMWASFGIVSGNPNTGAHRTRGPVPPFHLFPNKPGLDMFFPFNGSYYVGSIMATMGYNWKEPQDFRFWIVNVPTQAETVGK